MNTENRQRWNGLSGDQLVFQGAFDDGSQGVFIANLAGSPPKEVPILPLAMWLLSAALLGTGVARLRFSVDSG